MIHPQWTYDGLGFAIRADLAESLAEVWPRLGEPGTWWTGAERVAIVAETRAAADCSLCRARKQALSPYTVDGSHTAVSDLPAPLVEIVHRVATDAGRITRSWFAEMTSGAITDAHYVEAVIAVGLVVGADTFARAIGAGSLPLPAPVAGEPSRVRPTGLADHGAFVPMIAKGAADPGTAGVFNEAFASTVPRSVSLVPDQAALFLAIRRSFYLAEAAIADAQDDGGRALSRPQIELLVTRVSEFNGCYF